MRWRGGGSERAMRALLTATLVIATVTTALAQPTALRRAVPLAVRRALVGCWQPWPGERWVVEERGRALSVRIVLTDEVRSTFAVRGALRGRREQVLWDPARNAARFGCGPTTQHGQECAMRVEGDAAIVTLVRLGYRGRATSSMESRAERCERR